MQHPVFGIAVDLLYQHGGRIGHPDMVSQEPGNIAFGCKDTFRKLPLV
jgi:hypothetical protein